MTKAQDKRELSIRSGIFVLTDQCILLHDLLCWCSSNRSGSPCLMTTDLLHESKARGAKIQAMPGIDRTANSLVNSKTGRLQEHRQFFHILVMTQKRGSTKQPFAVRASKTSVRLNLRAQNNLAFALAAYKYKDCFL
jgi:hypothetical protein